MSIKKLFDSTEKSRNYLTEKNSKDAFEEVESSRNLEQLRIKQEHFQPQIDYNNPEQFARFGSAILYYKSAFTRILDYYPYDGSATEVNKFTNDSLDIENYILDNLYPRTNGYARINYVNTTPDNILDGYGYYATDREFIKFYGGPGTGSVTSTALKDLSINKYNDQINNANVYDTNLYKNDGLPSDYGKGTRQSNLRSNFDDGVTIEFWLDQDSNISADPYGTWGQKKVVFDMWNGAPSASADYGRITLALEAASTSITADRFFTLTCQSGTTPWVDGATNQTASGFFETTISDNFTTAEFQKWNHYAVTIQNSGSSLVAKFFVTGGIQKETTLKTGIATGLGEINPKPSNQVDGSTWKAGLRAHIGALITAPSSSALTSPENLVGAGRLSGSIDEFRFWKTTRSSREIGTNYFTQIKGGTNTDISNTTLGVYYKFNEGITGNSSVDKSVLDYAGRVTNGVWTGYTAGARNVGSAIVSASAATKEFKDPIIRPNHPDIISLRKSLVDKGQYHDLNNNSSMLSLLPGWIVDDEEVGVDSDLQNMCHIVGAYFDKLYLQISQISRLKNLTYTSASHKPFPFAEHLPQSLGLYSPELFVDASVMEKFINRDDTTLFEGDLHDTKNLIYSNLYNNLTAIYKSKGTEKAIKNIFRCFNIDEKLLRLTINSNREEFTLHNNVQQTLIHKNCANFNTSSNTNAVIYQYSSSVAAYGPSQGYITGAVNLLKYGFTAEANIVFPHFDMVNNTTGRDFISSSLFGAATVLSSVKSGKNLTGEDTTFANNFAGISNADVANFQVTAVRTKPYSKDAYFVLESKYAGASGAKPFPILTSSTFLNVYDNEEWNISVRLKPSVNTSTAFVEGTGSYTYDVEFYGVNTINDTVANTFKVSSSISQAVGQKMLYSGKRLYVGALRTNLTGAIVNKSDVLIPSVKYWTKYLEDSTLKVHALDVENIGISGSMFPLSPLDTGTPDAQILNSDTLALNWNFLNVTGADGTGNFLVQDFSSGSYMPVLYDPAAPGTPRPRGGYSWMDKITKKLHAGFGYGFQASSANAIDKRSMNSYRFINPEHVVSSDMITIFDDEDRMYPPTEFVPNYVYTIEKSLYNAISEEMLDFFAGVVDFNTVIGAPVNRYRDRYKSLEALRRTFFRRVNKVKQVEKYLNYYKWFDDAITSIIGQVVPVSAEFVDDILNVVEPHVLERPKYQSRFPTLNFVDPDVQGALTGLDPLTYSARLGRSTLAASPRPTNKHELYWKARAERSAPEITSGDSTIDTQRETIRKTVVGSPRLAQATTIVSSSTAGQYQTRRYAQRAFNRLYKIEAYSSEGQTISSSTFQGGVNFSPQKNLDFARSAVWPAGPINTEGGVFVPQNVLFADPEDYVKTPDFINVDEPANLIKKIHRVYKVQHGRDWELGQGYKNLKSTVAFPFSIMSSSARGGYIEQIRTRVSANLDITNIHNDVYGPSKEKPLQGPFTEYAVGGLQSRHIAVNFKATDTWHTRPEQFNILLGSCIGPPGAIGVVGPDYPWPEANNEGDAPYPMTGSKKAYLYRDFIAKRPVNIRNILMRTGSTILGNYTQEYEVLHSFGTYANPRHFIDNQPDLPDNAFTGSTRYATQMRTYLDVRRTAEGHQQLLPDYSVGYLTGTQNQQIITTRFSNPGSVQTMGVGYRDIRGNEYSVYNTVGYRNLGFSRTSQMPSGTISEATGAATPGIRLFDLHGKDIGEYAHRARHSARFGRDSVTNSDITPVSGTPAAYGLTGAMSPLFTRGPIEYGLSGYSYSGAPVTKLQAWWRLNTNISSAGNATDSSGNGRHGTFAAAANRPAFSTTRYPSTYVQTGSCTFDATDDATNILSAATWDALIGNDTGGGSTQKMTFATWVYPEGPGENNFGRILDFGAQDIALFTNSTMQIVFSARWSAGSVYAKSVALLPLDEWSHVAVTYDANDIGNDPVLYLNGLRIPATRTGATSGTYSGIATEDCFIGNNSTGARTWDGSLADIAVWNETLTEGAIRAIYHVGKYGLIESNVSGPGATYTQDPARYKIQRNIKKRLQILADGTYGTASRYDNYNVQHQIPQSDIQYNWIARSVTDPNSINYFNYQKTYGGDREFRKLTATTYEPFYSFVSASDEKGTAALAGGFQPVGRLNTLTLDAVSGTENTIGFPDSATAAEVYLNAAFNDTTNIPSASYLNLLLSRREATYGWTWRMWRAGFNSPVLIEEMKNNQLSAVTGGVQGFYNFSLPPVSMKGRTSRINYDAGYSNKFQAAAGKRNNITLRTAHTNDKIFFNERVLNNLASPNPNSVYTPLYSAIDMTSNAGFRPNWIIYSQNVFPSMRNEFTSRSAGRIGYDNKFWRNSNTDRVILDAAARNGAGTPNSFGVGLGRVRSSPAGGFPPSQSVWPLDAPEHFLTRTEPYRFEKSGSGFHLSGPRGHGKAGELQNTFSQYIYADQTSSTGGSNPDRYRYSPNDPDHQYYPRWANITLSPLYSRKHILGSPRSVVAPSGLDIPETGTLPIGPAAGKMGSKLHTSGAFGINEFRFLSSSDPFSGEALWEAPTGAGIILNSGSVPNYIISASNPWWNNYDAFHADLKLAARGYSTVPEFRISDHVEDYMRFGALNPGTVDTFNIPGTSINSTSASFYKDYSNSDFLQDFVNIKNKSMLDLTQIKLTVEAAIRFNPYKGFYPAQRTLDMVSQFSRSYGPGIFATPIITKGNGNLDTNYKDGITGSTNAYQWLGSAFRPVIAPLFAPGILYNSIKSGLAVDYPVVTDPERMVRQPFGGAHTNYEAEGPSKGYSPDNWALTTNTGQHNDTTGRFKGSYFDHRIPFEAIIEPAPFIRDKYLLDMEPHPSCSLAATASWAGNTDGTYTKMSANFFGEVGNFFLRDRDYTNLESNVVPPDIKFSEGEVFGARIVLRRSMRGARTYGNDSGSTGNHAAFSNLGGKTFIADDPSTSFAVGTLDNFGAYQESSYAIPQDPKRSPDYRENFTMYSRPTAFGPPLSGRFWASSAAANTGSLGLSGSVDCFDGYNWAYTPPYYHGEAWADLVFRPSASISYDLEKILSETKVYYWRADAGAPSGSSNTAYYTSLIPGGPSSLHGPSQGPGEPYAGDHVNLNAMQLSASFNLFGIERVFKTQVGAGGAQTNEIVGAKWIIQPKFETPMFDFGDVGLHPITSGSGNLTIPLYGSSSVPRGMWHQFGKTPPGPDRGIFLSIGEIPSDWLNNHWAVINSSSIYNNYTVPSGKERFSQGNKYKSLAKLFGFDRNNSSVRMGEVAESRTIREAVVAIPYVIEQPEVPDSAASTSETLTAQKKFIGIKQTLLTRDSEGLRASTKAGKSVGDMLSKMKKYVLPPQFDFISNPQLNPMAMYIFEFEYTFDKDDLSYMWQNLAPRDYQKMSFQKSAVAHELFDTEILDDNALLSNNNLRWMVFKVKQRSQVEYWDLIADQAREASTQIFGKLKKQPEGYDVAYNWPYDFLSFVEAIKVDVDVMYKNPSNPHIKQNSESGQKASKKLADAKAQKKLQEIPAKKKTNRGNNN
jgi:hypothetical protein